MKGDFPMKIFAISPVLLLACWSSVGRAAQHADDVRGRIPLDKFVIQAHRGGGVDLPENTLETYQAAWQWGVVPEADVRVSKDGVICAFHDENFARLAKGIRPEWRNKRVADLTWEELRQIDVGAYAGERYAGQRIARIDDALAAMAGRPDRGMYLDVKDVPLKELARLVKKHHVEKQVIFTTSRHAMIRRWKRIVPESQTLLWMGGSEEQLARKLEAISAADFEGITTLQIHVRLQPPGSAEPFRPSPRFLRDVGRTLRARHITYQAMPWGTTDAKVYHALLDLGVESFASDHPRITQQAVKRYYSQARANAGSEASPADRHGEAAE